jgi:hypothetical protein
MTVTAAADPHERRRNWQRDARYTQLVELCPDGILVHDDGWIVLANTASVRLAGATSREQLIGLSIDRFLDPPYLKAIQTLLTEVGASLGDSPPLLRDTLHRLDGSDLEVEVLALGFLDDDRPSVHLIIRDVSVRLEAERLSRRLTERLQEAQRMETVGALAGGVAHEVNNMMQVILGSAGFLLEDQRLPPDRTADLREIVAAADRASVVTRQLLAYSRRAVHHPVVLDLTLAARQSESVLRRLLGASRPLEVVGDSVTPVWVDPGQLQQIMVNMALNARDAMPSGGHLTIATREVGLQEGQLAADHREIPAGHYAALVVTDTGVGMDALTRASIFEPFFTTKPVGQGTGLGLSAVQGIVSQSSGFLVVTSAPGEGTTFTIYLPLAPISELAAAASAPVANPPSRPATGISILVIDDEPSVRAVAARILTRGGFDVWQAASGSEALELVARQGPPSVVVTDLMMAGMDGVEVARRLQEQRPGLPVVLMSGVSAQEVDRQTRALPGHSLLEKPFVAGQLLEAIAAAMARGAASKAAGPTSGSADLEPPRP